MSPSVRQKLPLFVTALIFVLLFVTASCLYDGFFSSRVLISLFVDNAFLGVTAVGMTLVIFSGGIDLSVGAVIGFTSIFSATLMEKYGVHPVIAALLSMVIGAALGAGMGALIHYFKQPAFLITLAGMFLARGGAYWISEESLNIQHPTFAQWSQFEISFSENVHVPLIALLLVVILVLGYLLAHHTRLGRNLLAIGGSEQSSLLMGLPIASTKIAAYTINGTLAAFAGIVANLNSQSGNSSLGGGLELDAISIVVIGGTLLAGGRGHMVGTLLGILVFGTIQQGILFDGRLDSGWMRIVVGLLLLVFILLQRVLVPRSGKVA